MRPPMIGDLVAVGRVLLTLPEPQWAAEIARLMKMAENAEQYRKTFRRVHPLWGNGSLMSAAGTMPRLAEPFLNDSRYVRALACVLEGLLAEQRSFASRPHDIYLE